MKKSFNPKWYPIEWLPFICFGPFSPRPYFTCAPSLKCKNPILRALKTTRPDHSSSPFASKKPNKQQQRHDFIGSSSSKGTETSQRSSDDSFLRSLPDHPPQSSNDDIHTKKRSFDNMQSQNIPGFSVTQNTQTLYNQEDQHLNLEAFQSLVLMANKKLKSFNFLDINNYLPELNR